MNPKSAIVLIIDRLGAAYLGPYGNTWLETQGFNRLASTSLLCEQMLTNSPGLATVYRSYWQGDVAGYSLPQLAKNAGCKTVLVTDDEEIAKLPGAADFDELHLVATPATTKPADDVAETAFIRLMEAAIAQLETWRDSPEPQLLWIHARAMNGPWDAPLELRQQFADEDDPLPSETVEPPHEMLPADHDPDQVLSVAHAYAAQVSVVDFGLQALLSAIDELPQRDSLLLAVTSPRGYPLGEHLRIGECDQALYSELLHVPGFVRFPKQEGALARTQELIQPADLFATIVDAVNWSTLRESNEQSLLRIVRGEPAIRRDIACATAPNQRLIRTAAWQLRVINETESDRHELYAKPDDRYEFNDIATRATDIIRQLLEHSANQEPRELPEQLTSPWR